MARRELPKALTADQVAALLAMPNLDCPTGLRDRALLELLHRAGLRVSEACGADLRDVRWRERELHLRADVTKGQKEAVLPLDDRTLDWLERWKPVRRQYAAGSPRLFVTLKGKPLDRRNVWEMIRRRAEKAGVGRCTPHMLRHTYATELLRSGEFTIEEVRRLLRHEDVRTTQLYVHLVDRELAAKVRAR